jgi:predicted anti-sigma-YlaC factor YlaD
MSFSRYGEYVAALAMRNQLVLLAWAVAFTVVVFVLALREWPRWRCGAAWISVGGYYAIMAGLYFLGSAAH